ncbi:unnamed protein product [Paramecium sonneborni]|uniref:RING-type domain-containing protein n=1 Tax=Paramecium sonneborni TaxID=65129 RepID=A0A8S1R252_9CILI|nr:unnamed protein product [Paramecium sonneborni]
MLIQKQQQLYFRTKIKKIISYFCFHYLYYNLFAMLFALFQFDRIPFAVPLGFSITFEIFVCYYYSNKQIVKMLDHVLHIMAYNFVIILYYTNLQYYVFGNFFLLLSFAIRTKESCSSQITHEYSSIIRFLKTFYRFSSLVASVCVSLKLSKYVEWTWPQAFWWYWMFLSALVGTCFTLIIVLISKIINEIFKQNQTVPQEYKSLLWALYNSIISSILSVMWIINTFNQLGLDIPIKIGEVLFYSTVSFNLIIFCALTKFLWDSIIDFCVYLLQSQETDIELQRELPTSQITQQKQYEKRKAIHQIFLKKLSSAFFRQTTKEDMLQQSQKLTEIMTERGQTKKILQTIEIESKQLQDNQNKINESNQKCIICCDNPPNAVLMICGHGGICYKCGLEMAQKSKECFLCRQQIVFIYEISNFNDDLMKVVTITKFNY